jgi:DNA-binding beta-propeller fold protein YncE
MKRHALLMAALTATLPASVIASEPAISFTKQRTYDHANTEAPGQVSEIPAFDARTHTLWVAGVVGVDVLDANTGKLIEHIDVTSHGYVNSVAIHDGIAALAIEAPTRTDPGVVLLYDTRTRWRLGNPIPVGALPDMLTFTHDGSQLLVANEGTPLYVPPAPPGKNNYGVRTNFPMCLSCLGLLPLIPPAVSASST